MQFNVDIQWIKCGVNMEKIVTLFFSIYIYITVTLFFPYWPYILFIEHLVPDTPLFASCGTQFREIINVMTIMMKTIKKHLNLYTKYIYMEKIVSLLYYIYNSDTIFFHIYITVTLFFPYWPYILFIEHLVPVLYVTCKESNCKFLENQNKIVKSLELSHVNTKIFVIFFAKIEIFDLHAVSIFATGTGELDTHL
jgi:hypothetical protein